MPPPPEILSPSGGAPSQHFFSAEGNTIEQSLPSERRQTANFNRTDDKFDVVKALEYAESKHNIKLEQNLCMNHGITAAME